ncbi:MAG: type II toxin-antitoxin system HicB family antitoxin [Calditrichaeota bacterium]|nr:type II toxin-antitoxin system HicB family antitoxin [Calditrichota bacterium]
MKFGIVFEQINDSSLPEDYYYAHVPALGLTTHGLGIDGAKAAAMDLIKLWIDEKQSNGESVKEPKESLYSVIEIKNAL